MVPLNGQYHATHAGHQLSFCCLASCQIACCPCLASSNKPQPRSTADSPRVLYKTSTQVTYQILCERIIMRSPLVQQLQTFLKLLLLQHYSTVTVVDAPGSGHARIPVPHAPQWSRPALQAAADSPAWCHHSSFNHSVLSLMIG